MNKKLMFARLFVVAVLVGLMLQFVLKIDLVQLMKTTVISCLVVVGFMLIVFGIPISLGILANKLLTFTKNIEGVIYMISSGILIGTIETSVIYLLLSGVYLHRDPEIVLLYVAMFVVGLVLSTVTFNEKANWTIKK